MLFYDLLQMFFINLYLTGMVLKGQADNLPNANVEISSSRLKQTKLYRDLLEKCEESSSGSSTLSWNCVKLASLQLFENLYSKAVIVICPGVRFIRDEKTAIKRVDRKINFHQDWRNVSLLEGIIFGFGSILNTHVLELNLKSVSGFLKETKEEASGRHRRHRYNMLVTMLFGIAAVGAVIVPLGFQLLSIVSGKALLLAKMALLLASINGLKRVANTGLHYGLYHVPGEHNGGYYEREDVHRPRNIPNITPLNKPLEKGSLKSN